MLKKLLKYDLKWIYKTLVIFYILALFFAGLTKLLSQVEGSLLFSIITSISEGTTMAMIVNIVINNTMSCYARFVKNIYKDESYLTHTLPVKIKDIYLSKILTATITVITSILVMVLALLICYYTKDNFEVFKNTINTISATANLNSIIFILTILLIISLEFIFIIISGYIGIILGHKSNNNKIIKSIIFGFLFFMILSETLLAIICIIGLFSPEVMQLFKSSALPSPEILKGLLLGGIIAYTAYNIGYYLLGKTLLKKGVDVD